MSGKTTGTKCRRIFEELPIESFSPHALAFIAQVEQTYTSLMRFAAQDEASLGGKLLYAGELNHPGRTLTVAGNIAGAATLAASADPAVLRQVLHDGVIDFLVTSLDEALRILKNEIRKREPVSVAVSIAPEVILKEMRDRGVLPDLLPPAPPSSPAPHGLEAFIAQGAQPIGAPPHRAASNLHIWSIPAEFAQSPAGFDELLLEHLSADDHATRRWIRLSPRYLGPKARRLRSLTCNRETASELIERLGPPLQP